MPKRKRNIFLSSVLLFAVLVISANFMFSGTNFNILETSILSILQNLAKENAPAPPDLAIENVALVKIAEPTKNFNYYKYKAVIILHNYGGNITNSRLILSAGDDQKIVLVRNTEKGFSLRKDRSYILRDYEIIFDGRYNGGNITLQVKLPDRIDYEPNNNSYTYALFEKNPKIKDISLKEILNDGTFALEFDAIPFSLEKHDFEIVSGSKADFDSGDIRYDEIFALDNVYSYYKLKNSLETAKSLTDVETTTESQAHFVKFAKNPYKDTVNHFVYIKAVDPDTKYYAVSNVLLFAPQEQMVKAEFAKLFVEYTKIPLSYEGVNYFSDVTVSGWYFPYVQTLYNLGLLNTKNSRYYPEKTITRGDVIKIVLDYFDVDLIGIDKEPHFVDVKSDNPLYPYAQVLHTNTAKSLSGNYLNPDFPATRNYLKHLIYEYSESN